MSKHNVKLTPSPAAADGAMTIPAASRDVLSEILHHGAQQLLVQAINAEVAEWIERHADAVDDALQDGSLMKLPGSERPGQRRAPVALRSVCRDQTRPRAPDAPARRRRCAVHRSRRTAVIPGAFRCAQSRRY